MPSSIKPSELLDASPAIRGVHCRIGSALLALGVSVPLAFAALGHSESVMLKFESIGLREFKKNKSLYEYTGGFRTNEDYLLYHEIPRADYSRGSVVFFGGSNMRDGLMLWDVPPEQRSLIHNYGFGAATFNQEFQFLRYLVEQRGLLSAGGNKTLVIFGLFFGNAVDVRPRRSAYAASSNVGRYGLFTWDTRGIQPAPMSWLERYLRTEWAYCDRLNWFKTNTPAKPQHRPDAYLNFWTQYMGSHRAEGPPRQVEVFAEMVDYLQARNVRMHAVLMPLGSWFDGFPFVQPFRERTVEVCEARHVPFTDLSQLLNDEDFADSAHFKYCGLLKLHEAMMEIARKHCQEQGLISGNPAGL